MREGATGNDVTLEIIRISIYAKEFLPVASPAPLSWLPGIDALCAEIDYGPVGVRPIYIQVYNTIFMLEDILFLSIKEKVGVIHLGKGNLPP